LYSLGGGGGSRHTLFCAGAPRAGFDGTEVAPRTTIEERRTTAAAGDGSVTFDAVTCEHAGFCSDRFTTWRRLARRAGDPAAMERLQQMVRLCPSGALQMRASADGDELEPALAPSIGVVRDGPLFVRGRVEVVAADGERYQVRNRVTLCRCGHSGNKPFCDGSHREVGFRDG
jgi:CDGSH-type Zn-finger protein